MIPDIAVKNGFSLDRLTTLCQVVEAGSIVAAVGPNPSRQSQFSRQIKELEEMLGQKLFTRIGKTLKPTQAGLQLVRMTRIFLESVASLQVSPRGKVDTLNIGAGEALLRWIVVPVLSALRKLDPPVHGHTRSLPTASIIDELSRSRLDVGIVRANAVSEGLESVPVGHLRYVLAVPRILLRSRSADEVFSGKALPFVELGGGGTLATMSFTLASEAGITLNRVLQVDTSSLLLASVENEDVTAFLPALAAARLPGDRFALVNVPGSERLNRDLTVVWTREGVRQRSALDRGLKSFIRAISLALEEASRLTQSPN